MYTDEKICQLPSYEHSDYILVDMKEIIKKAKDTGKVK